ncbi:hypothetical protein [Ralstonia pseudosolanacearum]|uniref:Conjugal transfer protein TraN n=1 Tax=Ralstonia pseudosolanacearum TaxID=1310165 RepID=A0A454TLS6_9RALS|nr:hypothetical protein [Ralstonia pseudosolanacearum]RNM03063.1 hypothetical protein EGA29_19965 [Ralstonia pseudosolanacearum]
MLNSRIFLLPLLLCAGAAFAQSPAQVANGTAFARTLAPTSPSQIVNPAGVNGGTWSGQTAMPTNVPGGLAGFSNPNTDGSILSAAKAGSLTGLGNKAMSDCANYVPGSDQYRNQDCAAVNFLNNQCFQPSNSQRQVLGNAGFSQANSPNCAGTFGAGQSQFGYRDQVTINDPMFQGTLKLPETTKNQGQTCTTSTVVTKPAQYEYNTCIVSTDTSDNACSQTLSATIVNTLTGAYSSTTCPAGQTLNNNWCTSHTDYPAWVTCPSGYIQAGYSCVQTSSIQGTPYCPSDGWLSISDPAGRPYCVFLGGYGPGTPLGEMPDPPPPVYNGMRLWAPGSCWGTGSCYMPWYVPLQSCPDGYTFDGTQCTMTTTIGGTANCNAGDQVQGMQCSHTVTSPPTVTYSCPAGQTLNGTNCVKQTVSTSWSDGCTAYEQSAGVALPAPIN